VDHGGAAGQVEVGRVDVDAGGAESVEERKRLVEFFRDVETDVLGDAAVVGVEVFIVPLVATVGGFFAVVPGVVGADGEDVDGGSTKDLRYQAMPVGRSSMETLKAESSFQACGSVTDFQAESLKAGASAPGSSPVWRRQPGSKS
jgi:hypothetical protein